MKLTSDGIFTIKQGQGLSQAIAEEIGLSEEQCKKLDKSIWTQIMDGIDKQKDEKPDLYSGGNDINGKFNKNFIVKTGQVIQVCLTGIWKNILNIVNNALGTNFEAEEINNQDKNIPPSNKELAEKYKNETPHPELAGKQVKVDNNTIIEYDKNGYVRFVASEGKITLVIIRDNNGNIDAINSISYDKNDTMHNIRYDKDGNVVSYLENDIKRNSSGKIIEVLSPDTMKPESNPQIAEKYKNEVPHPEYAGRQVKADDNTTIGYDKNGYVRAVWTGEKISLAIIRDNNSNIDAINSISYDKNDTMHNIRYDKDGNVVSYFDGTVRRDSNGKIIEVYDNGESYAI